MQPGFTFSQWLAQGGDKNLRRFILGKSYERIAWVYACANVIANSIKGVPLVFKQPVGQDGELEVIEDPAHPIHVLFNPPSAPEIPSVAQLLYRTYIYLSLSGGLFWAFPRKRGEDGPTTIEIKTQTQVKPVFDDRTGEFLGWFQVDRFGKPTKAYLDREILPILYFNPDSPYSGLSPLSAARLTLEQEFHQAGWNAAFFRKGLRNPLAITYQRGMSAGQRRDLKEDLNRYYAGMDEGQGALVLGGGAKVDTISLPAKDMEFIEGKKINREEICGVFGVPPATVGIFEYANYANSKEQRRILWENNLLPKMSDLRELVQTNLLDIHFPGIVCEWDVSKVDVLRPDPVEAARAAKTYFDMGYSKNQVAEILGMPELADEEEEEEPDGGDDDADSGTDPEATPGPADEPEPTENTPTTFETRMRGIDNAEWDASEVGESKAAEAWWLQYAQLHTDMLRLEEDRLVRSMRRYYDQIAATLGRRVSNGQPVQLPEPIWLPLWRDVTGALVEKTHKLGAQIALLEMASAGDPGSIVRSVRSRYHKGVNLADYMSSDELDRFGEAIRAFNAKTTNVGADVIAQLNSTLSSSLQSGDTVNEARKKVSQIVEQSYRGRHLTIARTVTNGAYNNAKQVIYEQKGVHAHRWINAGDDHVRENHRAEGGTVVPIGELFPITQLKHPHDPNGAAKEVINCRCTTAASAKKRNAGDTKPKPVEPDDSNQAITTVGQEERFRSFEEAWKPKADEVLSPPSATQGGYYLGKVGVSDQLKARRYMTRMLDDSDSWAAIRTQLDEAAKLNKKRPTTLFAKEIEVQGTATVTPLTKGGHEKMVEFLTRVLSSDIKKRIPKCRLVADANNNRAFYSIQRRYINMPADRVDTLTRFFNDLAAGNSASEAIGLNSLSPAILDRALQTLAHEYGHHLQERLPDLRKWVRDFFRGRTKKEKLTSIAPWSKNEVAKPDGFTNRYQGRQYQWEPKAGLGTEVLPMYYQEIAKLPWTEWQQSLASSPEFRRQFDQSAFTFMVDFDGTMQAFKRLIGLVT